MKNLGTWCAALFLMTGCSGGSGGSTEPVGEFDLVITAQCTRPEPSEEDVHQAVLDALRHGDAACLKRDVSRIDVNQPLEDQLGRSELPIFRAVDWMSIASVSQNEKSFTLVKILIDAGADLSRLNRDGHNPLHALIQEQMVHLKYKDVIRYVIQSRKIKLDQLSADGLGALHYAIERRDSGLIQELVKAGADVSLPTQTGLRPFQLALHEGARDVLVYLIENGTVITNRIAFDKDSLIDSSRTVYLTALQATLTLSQFSAAEALLSSQRDLELDFLGLDDSLDSALLMAIKKNQTGLAKTIIARGANVDAAPRGESALHSAIEEDMTEVIDVLLPLVERKDALNYAGGYASLAIDKKDLALFKKLSELGYPLDKNAEYDSTPLEDAVGEDLIEFVKIIEKRHPIEFSQMINRDRALARAQSVTMAKYLIAKGAQPDADNSYISDFMSSSSEESDGIVLYLIGLPDFIKVENQSQSLYGSLLSHALSRNDLSVVEALLEAGIDPNTSGNDGKSALHDIKSVAALDLLARPKYKTNFKALNDGRSALYPFVRSIVREDYDRLSRETLEKIIIRLIEMGTTISTESFEPELLHDLVSNQTDGPQVAQVRDESQILSLLLRASAPVDAKDSDGNTPLAKADTLAEAQVLIEAGASLKSKNEEDLSPDLVWYLNRSSTEINIKSFKERKEANLAALATTVEEQAIQDLKDQNLRIDQMILLEENKRAEYNKMLGAYSKLK